MAGHVEIESWRRKLFEYHFFWQILYSQSILFVSRNIFHPSWRQFQSTFKSQFRNDSTIVFSEFLFLSEFSITIFYFLIKFLARSLLLKKMTFRIFRFHTVYFDANFRFELLDSF